MTAAATEAAVTIDGRKVLAASREGIEIAKRGGDVDALKLIRESLERWTVHLVLEQRGISEEVARVAREAHDAINEVVARRAAIGKGAFWGDKG